MAVTINMHNVKVKNDAKLMTDAAIGGDASINLDSVTIEGRAHVLSNLNVQEFCQRIESTYYRMTPEEYASIQKVLRQKNGKKNDFLKLLKSHLINFAEGVAASMVASCLTK